MKKGVNVRIRIILSFISILGLSATSVAEAAIYLYQLPDGSRLLTDRPKYDSAYKLVRASRKIKNMGQHAAGRYRHTSKPQLRRYDPLIRETADRYGVEMALIKAVIHTESYFNPNATSKKGASGLMQLMPETAERYGVRDLYSPKENLEAGVQHLKFLLRRYGNKLKHAIAAYNAGEQAVHKYGGIPPFGETRRYVKKVLAFRDYYRSWP